MLKKFREGEKGQGMAEYALILSLVSIVVISSLGGAGDTVSDIFDKVKDVEMTSGDLEIPDKEDETIPDYPNYIAQRYAGEEIDAKVEKGYIPISNADELNSIAGGEVRIFGVGTKWEKKYESGLNKQYIQIGDIDLFEIDSFTPIGVIRNEFKGTFDGGGYEIINLKVDQTANYAGLFGRIQDATIKNVGLINARVKGGNDTGGLVGLQSNSSVENSYATGIVESTGRHTGGLVGYQLRSSSVTNSYASVNVTGGANDTGGLVGGQTSSSSVSDSYATGSVTGNGSHTGGLAGRQNNASITNSYATGAVNGVSIVGGLVGQHNSSLITSSYYNKETTEQSDTGKGEGKTTAEMKDRSTYVGWDFVNVWKTRYEKYPIHQ